MECPWVRPVYIEPPRAPPELRQTLPKASPGACRAPQSLPKCTQKLHRASQCRQSFGQVLSTTAPVHQIQQIGIHPCCPPCPRKRWQQLLFGPSLPRAPLVRMMVVTRTPSNKYQHTPSISLCIPLFPISLYPPTPWGHQACGSLSCPLCPLLLSSPWGLQNYGSGGDPPM